MTMHAHFDCPTGVAGDMILGAMLDAGFPLATLRRGLRAIPLRGYVVTRRRMDHVRTVGTKAVITITADPAATMAYSELDRVVRASRLSAAPREMTRAILRAMAEAEAAVQRCRVSRVHYAAHDGIDAVIDSAGAALGHAWFGWRTVSASPLPLLPPVARGATTAGVTRSTLHLWRDRAVGRSPAPGEWVTPTGAAILCTWVQHVGENPLRTVHRHGVGFGDQSLPRRANALHLYVGEGAPLWMLEVNLDDMNPEWYDYAIERLLAVGAVDVTVRPVLMKKRRPAAQIQILCEEAAREACCRVLFRETTTFGVRFYPVDRRTLRREIRTVRTPLGPIPVKFGWLDDTLIHCAPEYEACKALARRTDRSLREIYRLAVTAAMA